jgi:fimbrial chaperone protein
VTLRGRLAAAIAALAFASAIPGAGSAIGTYDVKPVIVTFAAGATSASVEFTNSGDAAQELQIDVRSWLQSDARDDGEPTDDIIASPSIFTIAPGQTQLVRLGPARDLAGEIERSYRLVATEVPPAGASSSIQTIIRMRLPVFIAPHAIDAVPLIWRVERSGASALRVTTNNAGNVHRRVRSLRITAAGKVIFDEVVAAYVLAHGSRSWTIPLRAGGDAATVAVRAVELDGTIENASFAVR